jgi:hypothetical protein
MTRPLTPLCLLLLACGTTAPTEPEPTEPEPTVAGRCEYTNPFSQGPECKEYRGAAWTAATAAEDCLSPLLGAPAGLFTASTTCDYPSTLGECVIDGGTDTELALVFPGDDPGGCGGASIGCGFGGGEFVPSPVCSDDDPGPSTGGLGVFRPFEQVCVEPLAGEAPGASDGEVCTWGAISACTEEGRRYDDYASCDDVLTQRPYVPYPVTANTPADDERLTDTAYLSELAWVTEQVEACACICCHSTASAPEGGTSGWYIEAEPLWIDTLDDDGLAMLAGWVNSEAFGAFDPADNNGFDRSTAGLPTTDVDRMLSFLEGELTRRGLDRSDFADAAPFGGPLYDQIVYEPSACAGDEGVDADGKVTWTGGAARYVYVLEPDARSPGVPPNLDLPAGTLWRLDVGPDDDPVTTGLDYGATPPGTRQAFPAAGAPAALQAGSTYYLYVLRDIYQPLTRCLFTYER